VESLSGFCDGYFSSLFLPGLLLKFAFFTFLPLLLPSPSTHSFY